MPRPAGPVVGTGPTSGPQEPASRQSERDVGEAEGAVLAGLLVAAGGQGEAGADEERHAEAGIDAEVHVAAGERGGGGLENRHCRCIPF